jgi:hypothetical protein
LASILEKEHHMRNESMAMRRIIRANRLLIEQGHKGDTLGALNEMADLRRDAERYRLLRRGQHWSVIDYIGDPLRGEVLDAAVDARLAMHANTKITG